MTIHGTQPTHGVRIAFDLFWEVYPRPRNRALCLRLFAAAVTAGNPAERIASAAIRYRAENAGAKRMYLAYADRWLTDARWMDYPEGPILFARSDAVRGLAVFWASRVKAKAYIAQTAISPEVVACMIGNRLVTEADLLRAGVRI